MRRRGGATRTRRSSTAGTVLAGAVLAGALVVGATACSDEVDGPDGDAPTTTTTTTAPGSAADLLPTPPAASTEQISGQLASAAESGDFCTVLAAVDLAEPSATPTAGVVTVYRALADATAAARAFVPDELRLRWEDVVAAAEDVAATLDDNGGDLADPKVDAALTSSATVDALAAVERYELTACPAPQPVG